MKIAHHPNAELIRRATTPEAMKALLVSADRRELLDTDTFSTTYAASIFIVKAISMYAPQLFGRDELSIVIGGANLVEIISLRESLVDLERALDCGRLTIRLVNPELAPDWGGVRSAPSRFAIESVAAEVTVHPEMLVHHRWRVEQGQFAAPDLIVMPQPGIEFSARLWLRDEGLRDFVANGVPVVLSAYNAMEAQRDSDALSAVGYQVTRPEINPAAATKPHSGSAAKGRGDQRYAAYLYALDGVDREQWGSCPIDAIDRGITEHCTILSDDSGAYSAMYSCLRRAFVDSDMDARLHHSARMSMTEGMHPHWFQRWQIMSMLHPAGDPNDYYLGQALAGGCAVGLKFVEPFVARHPRAAYAVDGLGCGLLVNAARNAREHPDLLDFAISLTADLDALDDGGWTALLHAAVLDNVDGVRALRSAGAKIRVRGGFDFFAAVIERECWQVVTYLLQDDADAGRNAEELRRRCHLFDVARALGAGAEMKGWCDRCGVALESRGPIYTRDGIAPSFGVRRVMAAGHLVRAAFMRSDPRPDCIGLLLLLNSLLERTEVERDIESVLWVALALGGVANSDGSVIADEGMAAFEAATVMLSLDHDLRDASCTSADVRKLVARAEAACQQELVRLLTPA